MGTGTPFISAWIPMSKAVGGFSLDHLYKLVMGKIMLDHDLIEEDL